LRRTLGATLLLLGLALTATGFLPLQIVYNTPTYTADAIILYDAAFPSLTYDESISKYTARLYYQINFQPQTADTKYYYIVEASNVNAQFMWMLAFYDPSTGGLGSGVGSWALQSDQKWSGVEIAGYTLIPWTWQRNGTDYMVIDLKSDSATLTGNLKVYIKWTVPPPPTYTITITNILCQGLNQQITVQGAITPAVGGKQIKLTVTYPSGKIETRYFQTNPDGTYAYTDPTLTATETGTYTIQTQVDTTTSEPHTLTITLEKPKPAPIPTNAIIGIGLTIIGVILILPKRKA
jgi:hypothetical protein